MYGCGVGTYGCAVGIYGSGEDIYGCGQGTYCCEVGIFGSEVGTYGCGVDSALGTYGMELCVSASTSVRSLPGVGVLCKA
jgi:hypothetical protein